LTPSFRVKVQVSPSSDCLPRSVARSGTRTILSSFQVKVVRARCVSEKMTAVSWKNWSLGSKLAGTAE
jgi:hypothetical protein